MRKPIPIKLLRRVKSNYYWLFRCRCGTKFIAVKSHVNFGNTNSCGCYAKQRQSETSKTHGHSWPQSLTYKSWHKMKDRCLNKNHKAYKHYGGRGIRIHKAWLIFENFLKYLQRTIGLRTKGKTLDRINVNGNYEPGNIRWATQRQQSLNKRPRMGNKSTTSHTTN